MVCYPPIRGSPDGVNRAWQKGCLTAQQLIPQVCPDKQSHAKARLCASHQKQQDVPEAVAPDTGLERLMLSMLWLLSMQLRWAPSQLMSLISSHAIQSYQPGARQPALKLPEVFLPDMHHNLQGSVQQAFRASLTLSPHAFKVLIGRCCYHYLMLS